MSNLVPVTYRIPAELKQLIDQSAKDNGRSANAEAVHLLTASLNGNHAADDNTHDKLDEIIVRLKALNAQ